MRLPRRRDNNANGFRRLMNTDTINISMYASFSIMELLPFPIFIISIAIYHNIIQTDTIR